MSTAPDPPVLEELLGHPVQRESYCLHIWELSSPHPRRGKGWRRSASTTQPTARMRCTDTRAAGARSRGRSSTAVPLGEGMHAAISEVEHGYREMIEG